MRHVREELGLVLRGQRQLRGLLLETAPRQLDLVVLGLDVAVALLEQGRLLLQLLIGATQLLLLGLEQLLGGLQRLGLLLELGVGSFELLLAALQLLGLSLELLCQRLRLLQQLFGAHVRCDRVEHHAERLHQLLEKGPVYVAVGLQGGQLDHAEDLLLEQDRHHDDVHRHGLAESRRDPYVVGRGFRDEDALALDGGLADEPLAESEAAGEALALLVAIARDQVQASLGIVALE